MLNEFTSRCQVVAGALAEPSSHSLPDQVASLLAVMPLAVSLQERVIIHNMVTRVIARVLAAQSLKRNGDFLDAFLGFTAYDVSLPTWHAKLCGMIRRCARELRAVTPHKGLVFDSRVCRALDLLGSGFYAPRLSLPMCAAAL